MTFPRFQWHLDDRDLPPAEWQAEFAAWAAHQNWPTPFIELVGQLLWQRGWRQLNEIRGYLDAAVYEPTAPGAFGEEMTRAIARLSTAHQQQEKVAIWGDFDADGLTATAVLWEGLGQFFPQTERLRYYIPNRFTESHGLSIAGLDELAAWGCNLVVTCDTGSTATTELAYAAELGMDVIVTDHHTLAESRPPIIALINPRQLPEGHPLADLSGVAVAYKLMEALYAALPEIPQQPLTVLLDLVAIGLIADLVALRGDCRYLTQRGLQVLEAQAQTGVRPGVTKLLEFCKRTGDRPSDVAFGIGPRINAVSRIHGDASFGVELLTSRDRRQAEALALEAELANTRRKELQANVLHQAQLQLAQLDLSTTQVILLSDPQWSPGVLGLVASQIAQEYDRPTILFQTKTTAAPGQPLMARGSARSVHQIDLYALVKAQDHLLTSFGGHPFAAGMTLPVENLPLLSAGLNRAVRAYLPTTDLTQPPPLRVDCEVTVTDLGKDLFRTLKLLEPYGMGNPTPRLLLRQVQITNLWEETLKDRRGGKQRYHKLSFDIVDPSTEARFSGHWWGHRRADLPEGHYDLVVELDVNMYKKRYEARLVDLRPVAVASATGTPSQTAWLIDQRDSAMDAAPPPAMFHCPTDWSDFVPYRSAHDYLTLAYPPPSPLAAELQWQQLLGVAKYLARTGERRSIAALQAKLGLSDRTFDVAIAALQSLGYTVQRQLDELGLMAPPTMPTSTQYQQAARRFLSAWQEEHFRQQYFYEVPVDILEQVLGAMPPNSASA
ncbi:single-stranded-DNA-specific exonuclease RecJ [Leptolyngbya iicbica]|uniref:Single-stranded-DNA-specific exonuclease RecJ n=2 Tax=Cyanophyceae TaxID=3028117 RepID=A0A4Q7E8M6_9CYAN|nr:single-stranded-DNA-specific exonuclease RecJ [Leptolyngbya sp. LK]RZM78734.1 single-stranded-DNA-specific exonuclease RecJ [Leptolyngbya sp. LK]